MISLTTQALRLTLRLDQELEKLEDSERGMTPKELTRYQKLRRTMVCAEIRYYRRSQRQRSSYSLVSMAAGRHA